MINKLPSWAIGLNKSGKMNKEIMHKNLLDFKEVMDKQCIPFVFIFGGLLGLIRDGRLIDWDNDVEFMCYAPDHRKMKSVVLELENKGFRIPDKNECPFHDHFFIREGEKIEIWWFQKIDEEYIYDNRIRYPSKFFNDLREITFLKTNWKIPNNSKEFLEITYGKDWRTPNPKGKYIL